MVRGCLEWQALGGLKAPAEVKAATGEYRAEMDVLAGFLEECCVIGDGFRAKASKLLDAYRAFVGESHMTQVELARRLVERGFRKKTTNTGVMWLGIGLRELGSGEGLGEG
jgi:putative DNA primase/helicase